MQEYGLIGGKLSHSLSGDYFNTKFSKEHIPAEYHLFELDSINELPSLITKHPQLRGLNVTIPYKEAVIPFLDELDIAAQAIGAVNTIRIIRNGDQIKLIGYNTDYLGFAQSIRPFLAIEHERALILGTGGSAKAVAYALKTIGIPCLMISRKKRIDHLTLTYEHLNEYIFNTHLLVINTTPLGMFPDTESFPPIPYAQLNHHHLVYDLIYTPERTVFLAKAKERGATIMNGKQMLKFQADHAWKIWNME